MHFRTHVRDEVREEVVEEVQGPGRVRRHGMVEHDMHIGQFLNKLDELGIADNTIVSTTRTDNGPHYNTWPDAAATPFQRREEHQLGGRLARSVPPFAGPAVIEPGSVTNRNRPPHGLAAHVPRGGGQDSDIKERPARRATRRRSIEARSTRSTWTATTFSRCSRENPDAVESPRKEIFYFSDTGDLTALRYANWKMIFLQQKAMGTLRVWMEPWVPLRVPMILHMRRDPYERAPFTSNTYYDWMIDRVFLLVPAQAYVANFLKTFKDFPPRMRAASFSIDQVMEMMQSAGER